MSQKTHGMAGTRLYSAWASMKQRCYYLKAAHYQYYGGRGIKVCDEWRNDFPAFQKWAYANGWEDRTKSHEPKDRMSLDRIDNNLDYSPQNCQWITVSENTKKMNKK